MSIKSISLIAGETSILTINCKTIMDRVVMRFTEAEDRLMKLEKMINPLLDDNDQNALSYILDNIINEKIKTMSESWPFMKPVNKKQVKDYYEKIKQPMDLESMSKKISSHKYHSRQEFVDDMKLIYNNSLTFNGEHSEFTMKAKMLLDVVEETLIPFAEHCELLEAKIRVAQKRAIEQAEIDSLGTSITDDQEPRRKKKRRHNTSGTADMSPGEDAGDILDDLQYRYNITNNVVHDNNAVIVVVRRRRMTGTRWRIVRMVQLLLLLQASPSLLISLLWTTL